MLEPNSLMNKNQFITFIFHLYNHPPPLEPTINLVNFKEEYAVYSH